MDESAYAFRSLTLPTLHLEKMEQFYGETLGLAADRSPDALVIQVGRTKLRFFESESAATFHFAIDVPEGQTRDAQEWLQERLETVSSGGIELHRFESWDAHAVYFFDPAGNIVEFIGRHTLPNAPTMPFHSASLLAVSEVGIPVDDVSAAVEEIEGSLGWRPYRDPASDFAAVGSEHGLLILARTGRTWFPTEDMAALPFPAVLEIASDRRFDPFWIGLAEIRPAGSE